MPMIFDGFYTTTQECVSIVEINTILAEEELNTFVLISTFEIRISNDDIGSKQMLERFLKAIQKTRNKISTTIKEDTGSNATELIIKTYI